MSGPIYRLIYKSESAATMSWALVTSILLASNRNNERSGITGVLLLGKTQFLQVLEGEYDAVNSTFERISRDSRHRRVRLVCFDAIEERLFPNWDLRGVGIFAADPPVTQSLMDRFGEENGELRFPEEGGKALELVKAILELQDVPDWVDDRSTGKC